MAESGASPNAADGASTHLRLFKGEFNGEAEPTTELRLLTSDLSRAGSSRETHEKRSTVTTSSSSAPAAERLQPTPELLRELEQVSQSLEAGSPEEIIRWGVERFGERLTMGTAFGPEGMVILEMLSRIGPATPVFNLDTGYQFQETLDLANLVRELYGIEVRMMRPEMTVEQYEAAHGGPVYKDAPDQCCFDRKIQVLHRAIEGRQAWISAIRRDQSPDRARAAIVGWDKKFSLVKINPLANCTKNDIWKWIIDRKIPYNPLHDKGYTSIGCWPCTRAVMFGEDERAGRWSGSQKTECGLHSLD